MKENKPVNVTKQYLRNLRTSQQDGDERSICNRCFKKKKEVKTRPSQYASYQNQGTDRTHKSSDYDHDQESSIVCQDTCRYCKGPSHTEIVIDDVKTIPRRKICKLYVKENDDVGRNVVRKRHQIKTDPRHGQNVANVSMQSYISEEPRKLMVNKSVGVPRTRTEEYKPAGEIETVGDIASIVVHRRLNTDIFMIHKPYNREKEESSETLVKDIYKCLDIDVIQTYPIVGNVSRIKLLKAKQKEKKTRVSRTNSKESKPTDKSIPGSKLFLSLRRRFESLRSRCEAKQEQSNNIQRLLSPTMKHSRHYSTSNKTATISSDTPSLLARPYHHRQNISYDNNAKVKYKFSGKKNLNSDKCSRHVNAVLQTKLGKKYQRKINSLLKSIKKAANFGIPGKNNKKACRCNVKSNTKMIISDNPDSKVAISHNTFNEFKNIQEDAVTWLDQFISNNSDANENKVIGLWENNNYRRSSSSTIFELIDCLYKDTGLDLRSSIENSEQFTKIKHNNPFHQTSPPFVLPSHKYKIPIDIRIPLTIEDSKKQNHSKKTQRKVQRHKCIFGQRNKQSSRTETVLHALHTKGKSYEYYEIDITSELLSRSNKVNGKQSDKRVLQVGNFEMPTSSKVDETFIKAKDFEHNAVAKNRRSKFTKIVDPEIESPIKSATTEYESDSIKNGVLIDSVQDYKYYRECTTQSYANSCLTDLDSHALGIDSKSCPKLLDQYEAYIDNYIDNIYYKNSLCSNQSRMTKVVKQLKIIWHKLQRKEALSEIFIDREPNVLEVFRNRKLNAGSGALSMSDGVDLEYELNTVWMKKNPKTSQVPSILESQEEYSKDEEKSVSTSRVTVIPWDGDVILQKSAHGQKEFAYPIGSLYDREAVVKKGRKSPIIHNKNHYHKTKEANSPQRKMLVSDETIERPKYKTIASTSSMSIMIQEPGRLKLIVSSIDMAGKRRTPTQFSQLFQDTHYSFNSKMKSQSNTFSQSTQENNIRVPKETQLSRKYCHKSHSTSNHLNASLLGAPSYQNNSKIIITQKPLKGKSKSASKTEHSCSESYKDVTNAMSNIIENILQCPKYKSKDLIQKSLCKVMDNLNERPLCSLKSVLGLKPCFWEKRRIKKSHNIKQTENKSGKKAIICKRLDPFEDISTLTLTKSLSKNDVPDEPEETEKLTENRESSRVSERQDITESCPCRDKSLSKKSQTLVKKDLHHFFSPKQSVKVSIKPLNVPITPGAKGEDIKELLIVQNERAEQSKSPISQIIVKVVQPYFVDVKSENTRGRIMPSKIPTRCTNIPLVLTDGFKQHVKNKPSKHKTIAAIIETAHAVKTPKTFIPAIPRHPKAVFQRAKQDKQDSLKSPNPEQSKLGKEYSVMKYSETRKRDKKPATSVCDNKIQLVTIPSQKKTIIADDDILQKKTKPSPKCSPSGVKKKLVKQQTYAKSVPFKERLTDFRYAIDQSSLSTQCKLENPQLSLNSEEFHKNISQLRIYCQRGLNLGAPEFGSTTHNSFNPKMIDSDKVKKKNISIINPGKNCLVSEETSACTEIFNYSISNEEKNSPSGNKNSSDETCLVLEENSTTTELLHHSISNQEKSSPRGSKNSSEQSRSKSQSEETSGSFQDKSNSKKSHNSNDTSKDASGDSRITTDAEQYLLSVNHTCKDNKSKLPKLKSITPEEGKTCSRSREKSSKSQKPSNCYCSNCQETTPENSSNKEKSSPSCSKNSSHGSSSKSPSAESSQSSKGKSIAKKSDSRKNANDTSNNASNDSTRLSVCLPCFDHTYKNDDCQKNKMETSSSSCSKDKSVDSSSKNRCEKGGCSKGKDDSSLKRRDYSANNIEELEGEYDRDSNYSTIEIRFTLKICPDGKTKEMTLENVDKNVSTIDMSQTNSKHNQAPTILCVDDAIKPSDVNVVITIKNLAHQKKSN